jgi:replicative DNA helicase
MSAEQLAQRMVAAISQIDAQRLRLGNLHDDEWPRFADAIGHLSDLPIYIDDTPSLSVLQLRTKCRRLASERPLEIVFVDYLQLMSSDAHSDNRVQEVSYISRSLKGIARELDVPLMTASQLSRAVEQRTDKKPVLSDLRESGCLTGETLVHLADGRRIPIRDLAQAGILTDVIALNEATGQLEAAQVKKAWYTGVKPVFRLTTQLGRQVRASANHRFLTREGWKPLDALKPGKDSVRIAQSDTDWDKIASIEPDSEADVYDLTVPGCHNFVANDIIVHNSLEQDADIVMFIYREELYNENTEQPNIADLMIAKHRSGPTGTVQLYFNKRLTQFLDAATVPRVSDPTLRP